jgi:trk system potassium uptake protein TrkA
MYILIIGGGKVGFNLAYTLTQDNEEVRVVDKNQATLEKFKELPNVKTLQGDGTDPRVMETCGITRAEGVAAVTGSDVDNLAAALLAKRQFGVKRVIARVNNLKNEWLFTKDRGVDFAVNGAQFIARVMHEEVTLGHLITLLKLQGGKVSLAEEEVLPNSRAAGKTISELDVPNGLVMAAILHNSEMVLPHGETRLEPGDKVLAFFRSDQSDLLRDVIG